MTGRPKFDFTPEITDEICERIIGGESVRKICKDKGMPAESTVYLHIANDEAFRSAIARARELQQDVLIDETVDMADAATVEDHQVVKLRIWARQWRAAKLASKKYGDKITNEHTGKDGAELTIQVVKFSNRSEKS